MSKVTVSDIWTEIVNGDTQYWRSVRTQDQVDRLLSCGVDYGTRVSGWTLRELANAVREARKEIVRAGL